MDPNPRVCPAPPTPHSTQLLHRRRRRFATRLTSISGPCTASPTLSVLSPWFPRVTGGFLIPVHKIVNNAERFPFGPGIKATIHAKFNTSTVQCVSPLLANSTFWLRVNSI